jgi:transcriptional regulator with XRE-family HTH domain
MDFAEKLCVAMSIRDVTAKELAHRTGISESRISQYRKGVYKPKTDAMNKLAVGLSVNPNWFDGTSDDMETYHDYQKEGDLTPFDMRLLNAFHNSDDNIKEALCLILGIDAKGVRIEQTREFTEEQISDF